MIKTKYLLALFIPAILIASLALFVRFIQYDPLLPSDEEFAKFKKQKENFQIPIYPEDPIMGNPKSLNTVIAFADFGCQGCNQQITMLQELISKHNDKIRVVWKGLPVTKFPHPSDAAHEYAICLNKQEQFLPFYNLAVTNSNNLSQSVLDSIVSQMDIDKEEYDECINSGFGKSIIQNNQQLALILNIQSVPTFFLNNKQINTPSYIEGWETLLGL